MMSGNISVLFSVLVDVLWILVDAERHDALLFTLKLWDKVCTGFGNFSVSLML